MSWQKQNSPNWSNLLRQPFSTLIFVSSSSLCGSSIPSPKQLLFLLIGQEAFKATFVDPNNTVELFSAKISENLKKYDTYYAPIFAIVGPSGVGKSRLLKQFQATRQDKYYIFYASLPDARSYAYPARFSASSCFFSCWCCVGFEFFSLWSQISLGWFIFGTSIMGYHSRVGACLLSDVNRFYQSYIQSLFERE
jgi:hypothetical protein